MSERANRIAHWLKVGAQPSETVARLLEKRERADRLRKDRPELFWEDGIHLRPQGARVYAALVAAAVNAP